jgi:hypothetical protein
MAETAEPPSEDERTGEGEESVTALLEQLGRELGALVFFESRLAAGRHRPELRQAGLGAAAGAAVAVAFVTAFALANVAAVQALAGPLPSWGAALVVAALWIAVGTVVALVLLARIRRVHGWELEDAEAGRDAAQQAVRETLERLSPVVTREIALAAVPMAGDVAGGVVDVGEDIIESADDIVEALTEGVPAGSVVNQMWDVVLMPGRFGVRVATTVLRRPGAGNRPAA